MTVRNLVFEVLKKEQNVDNTTKEITQVTKKQGLFVCDKNVSFILRNYTNLEKQLFQIINSVE